MKFWKYRWTIIAGLMMVAAAACGGNNDNTDPRGELIGTPQVIGSILTAAQLDAANDFPKLTGNAKCDVTVVQINYQTPGVQPGEMTNASDVFNSPYDSFIEALLPAVIYPADLDNLPPPTTAPETARDAIFKPAYLADLATNPDNPTVVAAKKQDLFGWNPQAPTTLCGSSEDPVVSFTLNAQRVYDDFTSRGVSPVTLKLVDVNSSILSMYGSEDYQTFIDNYHHNYEPPFCYQVAKDLFDQYK